MEVNAQEGYAKYSKLVEDNPRKDNETLEAMDKQKAEKLVLAWFENNNPPNSKETQGKIGLKTLVGLSFVFLMIVIGLVAGLIVMDMKIKKLEHQNENLVQKLKAQENITQGLKAQNQNLSKNFEDMTNALVTSEFEIGDLKGEIQNLIDQNQKLIDDFEFKHQSLAHYQKLHQNCSKEQELSTTLIENLKSQNQNLTKDLQKIDSGKTSLANSIPDTTKNQLLVKAAKNGKIDQVRVFLDLGVDINATDNYKKSSLFYSTAKGDLEVAKLLLKHGADSNASDYYRKTPLHMAAKNGNLEIAELLLQNKADVNLEDSYGDKPIHYASKEGHLEVVKLLLKNGADVNTKTSTKRNSPLHLAASNGHSEITDFLLQNGADVNAPNKYWQAPIHLAAINGHPKVAEILLKHGARKGVKDRFGETPLMAAKYSKKGDCQQVIDLLQDH